MAGPRLIRQAVVSVLSLLLIFPPFSWAETDRAVPAVDPTDPSSLPSHPTIILVPDLFESPHSWEGFIRRLKSGGIPEGNVISLDKAPGYQVRDPLREQADHLTRLVRTESARRFGQRPYVVARGSGALVASSCLNQAKGPGAAGAPVEMLIKMDPHRDAVWWAGWAGRLGMPVPGLGRHAPALADLAPGSEFLREHAKAVQCAEAMNQEAVRALARAPRDLPPELARDLTAWDAERQALGRELYAVLRSPETMARSGRKRRDARELDRFGREVSRAAEVGNSRILASALTAAKARARTRLADLSRRTCEPALPDLRPAAERMLNETRSRVWRTIRLPGIIPGADASAGADELERTLDEWKEAADPTPGERVLSRANAPPTEPSRTGPVVLSPAAVRARLRAEAWGKVRQGLQNVERKYEELVVAIEKAAKAAQALTLATQVRIYAGDLHAETRACGRVPNAAVDELESRVNRIGPESDRLLRAVDLSQKTREFQTACHDLQDAARGIDPKQKIMPPVLWAYLKTLHTTAAGVVAEQAVRPAALEEGAAALQAAGAVPEWRIFSRAAARRVDREWARALEELKAAGGETWAQTLTRAQQRADWSVFAASARAAWKEELQAIADLRDDLRLAQSLAAAEGEEQRIKQAWTRSETGEVPGGAQNEDGLVRALALSRERRRLLAGVQRVLSGRVAVFRRLDAESLAATAGVVDQATADEMWELAGKRTRAIKELGRRVKEQSTTLARIARAQEEADEKLDLLVQASVRLRVELWLSRLNEVRRAVMEARAGQQAAEHEHRRTARACDTVERLRALAAENDDLVRAMRAGDARLGAALSAWHQVTLEAGRVWTRQIRAVLAASSDAPNAGWDRVAQVSRDALTGLDALSSAARMLVGESKARRALTTCAEVNEGTGEPNVRRLQNELWAIGDEAAREGAGLEILLPRLGRWPGPVDEAVRAAAAAAVWAEAAGTLDLARDRTRIEERRIADETRYAVESVDHTEQLDRITAAEREVERILYGSDGRTRRWLETSGLFDRWREARHASRNVELMADALAGEGLARMLDFSQCSEIGDPVQRKLEEDQPGREAPDWMPAGMRARWRLAVRDGEGVRNELNRAQEAGSQAVVWAALGREVSREMSGGGGRLQRQVDRLQRRSAQAARQMVLQARAGRAERRLRSLSTRAGTALNKQREGLKTQMRDFQRALREDGPSDDLVQEYCRDRAVQELEVQLTGFERLGTDWQDQLSVQSLELFQTRVLSLYAGVDEKYRDLGTSLQKVLDQTGPDPAWEQVTGRTVTGDLLAQISADRGMLEQVEQVLIDQVLAKHPALRELRRLGDLRGKVEQLKDAGGEDAQGWYTQTKLGKHLDRLAEVRAEIEAYLTQALTGHLAEGEMRQGLDRLLRRWSTETAYVSAALDLAPGALRGRQRDLLLPAELDRFKTFPGLLNGQGDQLAADLSVQAQTRRLTRTLGSMDEDVASLWDHLSGRSDLDLTSWMRSLVGHANVLASTGQALAAEAQTRLAQLGVPVNCTRFLQTLQGVYQASLDGLGQSVVRAVTGATGWQNSVPVLNFALTGAGSGAAKAAGEFIFPQKGFSDLFDPNALWDRISRLMSTDQWQFAWAQGLDGAMWPMQELGQEAIDQGLNWLGDRWGQKNVAAGAELGGPEQWLKKQKGVRSGDRSGALDHYLPEEYRPAKSVLGQVTFNGHDAEMMEKLAHYFEEAYPETVRRGRKLYQEAMTLKKLLSMSKEMQGSESLSTLDSLSDILGPEGEQAIKDHADAGRAAWSQLAGGSLSTVPTTVQKEWEDTGKDRVMVLGSGAYRSRRSARTDASARQKELAQGRERSSGYLEELRGKYGYEHSAGQNIDVAQYVVQGQPRGPDPVKDDRKVKAASKDEIAETGEYDGGKVREKKGSAGFSDQQQSGLTEDGLLAQHTSSDLDLEPAELGPNRMGIPRPEEEQGFGEGSEEEKDGKDVKEGFWKRGWNGAEKLLKEAAATWADPRRLNPEMAGPDQVVEKAVLDSEKIFIPEHEMSKQAKLAKLREKFPKGIFDPTARAAAIDQIEKDRLGYLAGYQYWEDHRTSNGERSNNVLLVEDGEHQYRVYRWVEKGKLKVVGSEVLQDKERFKGMIEAKGAIRTTWCNYAARVFSEKYRVPDVFSGKDLSANQIYDHLENSMFDSKGGRFRSVTWEEAVEYGEAGGLAYAVLSGERHGHIATIMGGFRGERNPENMLIYQAGRRFDGTIFKNGFGGNDSRKTRFYVWETI